MVNASGPDQDSTEEPLQLASTVCSVPWSDHDAERTNSRELEEFDDMPTGSEFCVESKQTDINLDHEVALPIRSW